jgi:hypothetical protein
LESIIAAERADEHWHSKVEKHYNPPANVLLERSQRGDLWLMSLYCTGGQNEGRAVKRERGSRKLTPLTPKGIFSKNHFRKKRYGLFWEISQHRMLLIFPARLLRKAAWKKPN